MIRPEKIDALQKRLQKLEVREQDLVERFILGSGKGGQKLQKTASCVYLKYLPLSVEVKCQKSRYRETNRYYARCLLCEKLEAIRFQEKSKKQQEIAKLRKQKKRRSKRAKEKVLEEKKAQSTKKELRKKVLHHHQRNESID